MPSIRSLAAILFVKHGATKDRCLKFLAQLQGSGQLTTRIPQYALTVLECDTSDDAVQQLKAHFTDAADNTAVLISDELAETEGRFPEEKSFPKSWVKEQIFDEFANRLLGTLAIMDRRRRVPDIDRVLWQNFDGEALLEILGLVADKLTYITPPQRLPGKSLGPVVIRPIRDKAELRSYFLLRYRVYHIMGYLEPWAEGAPSAMEINTCDTHALHVGAFVEGRRR